MPTDQSVTFPPGLISLLSRTLRRGSVQAGKLVALTGAGVSQESGLRTFRDAQTGLWAKHKPEDLASPQAFQRDPKLVWDWYAWRREAIKGARPNAGHYALVELESKIPQFTLITQNVDGLHRMAGARNLLELHGNIQRARCSDCGTYAETWDEDSESVPRCEECDGLLRPDVVWFGESLPRDQLEKAVEASRACDIFLSVGTSGVVQPAASLAHAAKNNGAVVVEVNMEPTPLTPKVDFFFQGKSGEVLPALVKAILDH
ncbi:MAG TPA: NAD-dependent deacylase [Anaerolineales bacterium]|nr:NAD-dependent deacylase [Anaerolineales bacterium]HNS60088.1 NAD-dependent deacylase [Anaerolineales bacterium]